MSTPAPVRRRGTVAALALALAAGPLLGTSADARPAPVAAPDASPTGLVAAPVRHAADDAEIELTPVGTYATGTFDASAAEIVVHHAGTQRLFVVNAEQGVVDVLDAADVTAPRKVGTLAVAGVVDALGTTIPAGSSVNSVDVRRDGLVVVAVEHATKTEPGWVAFLDATTLDVLGAVRVGAQPDKVTVSPDGAWAVTADEGEPDDAYAVDPPGTVTVVALPGGVAAPAQEAVRTAGFTAYDAPGALPAGVRVFGPTDDAPPLLPSLNLEPEYVTVDGGTAYVTLQEANAIATVDLASATVTGLRGLGVQDHGVVPLDPSDRDGGFAPRTSPGLVGLYQPDAIASYRVDGTTYLVTANEGDAREWGDYAEGVRVKDLGRGGRPPVCAPLAGLTGDADLGRLHVSLASGLSDDGTCYATLHAFGARSFSVWTTDGTRVFDSGADFEAITAAAAPAFVNSNHTESNLEGRSDDKGPEPEAVALGEVDGRTYAFVGFERVGGVAVYDVTDPRAARYVSYVNNRDFSVSVEDADDTAAALAQAGDLGPESIAFVAAADSPTGEPLLAVGNEVSGTTTLLAVRPTVVEQPVVTLAATTVPQGGTLVADVTGLAPGRVLTGVVVPGDSAGPDVAAADVEAADVALGDVTAGDDGVARVTWTVPTTTAPGAYRLVLTSAGLATLEAAFTVAAAPGDGGGGAGPGTGGGDAGGPGGGGGGDGAGTGGAGSGTAVPGAGAAAGAARPASGALAATGLDVWFGVLVALGLVGTGAALLPVAARRARRRREVAPPLEPDVAPGTSTP